MKSFAGFLVCSNHDRCFYSLGNVPGVCYRLFIGVQESLVPGSDLSLHLWICYRELHSLGTVLLDDSLDPDVYMRLCRFYLWGIKNRTVRHPFQNLFNEFKKQTHPHAIIPVRMDTHIVSGEVVHRVLAFAVAYMLLIVVSCIVLMLDGLGFEESIGAAVSAISNVGPGLGKLGPVDNFSEVPVVSKWFLSFLMMTGRLEIFTVLTLLVPGFWKQ